MEEINMSQKDEIKEIKKEQIEAIVRKAHGVTQDDVDLLVQYIKYGDQMAQMAVQDLDLNDLLYSQSSDSKGQSIGNDQRGYINLVVRIINHFLEYGFNNKGGPTKESEGFDNEAEDSILGTVTKHMGQLSDAEKVAKEMTKFGEGLASMWSSLGGGGLGSFDPKHPDQVAKRQADMLKKQKEDEEAKILDDLRKTMKHPEMVTKVKHYWDYLTTYCEQFSSVKFVTNQSAGGQLKSSNAKGLRWIILALNTENDLQNAFLQFFNDSDFLLLYNMETSHLWRHRAQIMEALDILQTKNFQMESKIVIQFDQYITSKRNSLKFKKSKTLDADKEEHGHLEVTQQD